MFETVPSHINETFDWTWDDYKAYVDQLEAHDLTAETLDEWLTDWSTIGKIFFENMSRAQNATNLDTTDEEAESRLKIMYATMFPPMMEASNRLNRKLVDSGLKPEDFEVPLLKMKTAIEIFREENLPLNIREQALGMEYGKVTGAQTVQWNGEETTLLQLQKAFQDEDRTIRERAWRLLMDRWLEDRERVNEIWVNLYDTRQEMAENVGLSNYRELAWKLRNRFDYTPEDCVSFQNAIEEVVVPAAKRANERRQARLGVDSLRPWDLDVDTSNQPPLKPWETIDDFAEKAEAIFSKVDPALGGYFGTMRREDLLDLPNRKGKGPGAYCTGFPFTQRPFIFMNAVGKRDDVRTLLHEAGHAFHNFEVHDSVKYVQQARYPIEFAEVASMAMELLAAPYLTKENGGYYTTEEAARDRVAHLEKILFFWPYMSVVDGFQHWAYTNGDAGRDPANCDKKWSELWDRFIHVDYTGLDEQKATGWHRKQHIYRYPFYYVEYGLAQLGSVQVWANALEDQAAAVKRYREALALGGTRTIPELYATAGATFAFDADTLKRAVDLIEETVAKLDAQLA